MRALFKSGPRAGLELVERPDPTAGTDEVVIRVLRTGICGTDHGRHAAEGAEFSQDLQLVEFHEKSLASATWTVQTMPIALHRRMRCDRVMESLSA